jgi:hypothetical protein
MADGRFVIVIPPPPGSRAAFLDVPPEEVPVDSGSLLNTPDGTIILRDRLVSPSGVQLVDDGRILDGRNQQIGQLSIAQGENGEGVTISIVPAHANGVQDGPPQNPSGLSDPTTVH